MSSRGNLRGVPYWEVFLFWSIYKPMIQRVVDRGNVSWDADYILEALEQQDMQMWVYEEAIDGPIFAIAVTQIQKFPLETYCEFLMASSNGHLGPDFWRETIKPIIEWAKQRRCTAMKITGRKGWERVYGWKPVSTVFKRAI